MVHRTLKLGALFAVGALFSFPAAADNKCTEAIKDAESAVEAYKACEITTDCKNLASGWLSMTAVNKRHWSEAEKLSETLESICGTRTSHDAFYSQYGIKTECASERCVVRDISSEEKRQELYRDTLSLIED